MKNFIKFVFLKCLTKIISVMKKNLLFSIAILMSFGIMAQVSVNNPKVKEIELKDIMKIYSVEKGGNYSPTTSIKKINSKNRNGLDFIRISTSALVISVLLPEQNCLSVNKDANLISFVHNRAYELGFGNIQISYSTDNGNTFDDQSFTIWNATTGGYSAQLPSSIIYNPNGATDLADVYALASGITATTGSELNGAFFASETFTGQNYNHSMSFYSDTSNGKPYNFMPCYYIQVSGEKVFLYGNHAVIDTAKGCMDVKTVVNIGTWNTTTNAFDWTLSEFTPVNDMFKRASGAYDTWGMYPAMAFADDGLTGYLIYTGRDKTATDTLSYLPMIYKTTDGGFNWTKIPFDWENASGDLLTFLDEESPVKRPCFDPIKDAVVDGLGQLHFTSFVYGAASNNPDSLRFIIGYDNAKGYIANTYLKNNDQDVASFVLGKVIGKDNDKETTLISPSSIYAITWDERLQMGKSTDGMNVVFSWLDTDSTLINDITNTVINNFPNVFLRSFNVENETLGPEINLTGKTGFAEMCYWLYLSNDIIDKDDTTLFVPMTISSLSPNITDPVDHYFINNVYVDKATGESKVGINEVNHITSETSIYPNPTSGNVNISFNDNARGKYNINVFNAIGSLVYSENIDVNSSVIRTINLENMPNGIYMVQISNNNSTNTKKVIKY